MHHIPTRRTFGVCLVEENDVARFTGELRHAQSFGSNPLLFPIVILCMSLTALRSIQEETSEECTELEETMGLNDENHEVAFNQMANFTRIPQRLNVLSAQLANIQWYCSAYVEALNSLEDQLQALPDGYGTSVFTELHEQMTYSRSCLEHIGFITKRDNIIVQSMIQTVRISLATSVENLCL